MSLQILLEDDHLLVLHKPATVAIQSAKTDEVTLSMDAEKYCGHPLWLVHRIDQPVSGIVLYAKNADTAAKLSEQFRNRTIQKDYLAFTPKTELPEAGLLQHYFERFAKNNKTIAWSENKPGLYQAQLSYQRILTTDRYQLLHIKPLTGRQHQIRAQLSAAGCPIKGDVKYGARRKNPDRSIHLHAWKIQFIHPVNNENIQVECVPPMEDTLWKSSWEQLQQSNTLPSD